MNRNEILIDEIKQIAEQYKDQVPGKRVAWPNAIKDRVLELNRNGLNIKRICEMTGLPYFTVLSWRPPIKGKFKQVNLPVRTATVTVPVTPIETPTATVTVTTGDGMKIEGLSFEELLRLIKRIK